MIAPPPPDRASRRLSPAARDALLLLALGLLFYAPALDPGRQFLFRDAGRMHFPVKHWIAEELGRGHLPEWNPYAGAGTPVVAAGVDAVLHPLNLLLALLPFGAAFKLWILLSALAGGLGAAAWARRLGAAEPGPLLAGGAFLLCGFLVSSTDNLTYLTAVASAPWLLAAGHAFATEGGPRRLALVALASLLTAAAGDPMAWGVAVGLAAVQAARLGADRRRAMARAALLGATCAVAAAPAVLPVILWMPHSTRGGPIPADELGAWNLAPARLLELVVPHVSRGPIGEPYDAVYEALAPGDAKLRPWVLSVYVGASVLALALVGAWRDARGRVLFGGAALLAWMAMGAHGGFGALAQALPVLGRLRYWEKLAAWPALLLAVGAGIGAALVIAEGAVARRLARGAAVAAGALLLLAVVAVLAPDGVGRLLGPGARGPSVRAALAENVRDGALHAAAALLLLAAVARFVAGGARARWAPVALVAVVALDLAVAGAGAWVLSPASTLADAPPLAVAARRAVDWPRAVTTFGLPDRRFEGLTLFESKWRSGSRVLDRAWNVGERIGNYDAYTGMSPARAIRARDAFGAEGLARGAALWGFSLAATPPGRGGPAVAGIAPPYDVVATDDEVPAWLVRFPHRPRAYVSRAIPVSDAEQALDFARREPLDSGRSAIEGAVPPVQAPGGSARIVVDAGERVVVDAGIDGEAPGLLVLSDLHAPGWTADVDGAEVPIERANYLVRGVWLPGGRHVVTFRYRTPGLREGWGAVAALGAALVAWALARRRRAATARA